MRPNKLKRKLQKGERAYAVTGFNSSDDIDNFAPALVSAGIDALWFDGEHGPVTPRGLGDLTRVCDLWGITPMVRIADNNQAHIFRHFDLGAQAVIVPHVSTKAEAENLVAGGKFPPTGERGAYLGRQSYGVSDYFNQVDDETMLVAMIENTEGVRNLDEILQVPHIDLFFIGAFDLAASLGYIKEPANPAARKVVLETIRRISAAGRVAGVFTQTQDIAEYASAGANFFMTVARNLVGEGARHFTSAK